MEPTWVFDDGEVDRVELSELYRVATLGDKSLAALRKVRVKPTDRMTLEPAEA